MCIYVCMYTYIYIYILLCVYMHYGRNWRSEIGDRISEFGDVGIADESSEFGDSLEIRYF